MIQRRQLIRGSLNAAVLGLAGAVHAQERVARVVLGFPPGGLGDVLARRLASSLKSADYASSVIVENRPGAGGRIAADLVRSAPPDGLSILLSPSSVMTILPHALATAPFHPVNDFTPVGAMGEMDMCMAINPTVVPSRTMVEHVEQVRRQPDLGRYGTPGAGTIPHFLGFAIARSTGARFEQVPYRGSSQSVQDLLGGQIPSTCGAIIRLLLDNHASGKLRILATSGARRNPMLPDVPTFAESGIRDATMSDYTGIWMTARSPQSMVDKVSAALVEFNKDTDGLTKLAMLPMPSVQRDFAERVRADHEMMGRLVKAAGFTDDKG